MKKIISVFSLIFILVLAVSCGRGEKLYVLSWGGYINEDVVARFEEQFNVDVVIKEATSNESMHNLIQTQNGSYDIALPSDYMIERLVEDDLLHEIDYSLIENYNANYFDPKLQKLRNDYFADNEKFGVPYFWGTLGIMYNDAKAGVRQLVEENSWAVFFEQELIPNGVSVGMYNSSRDAVSAALFYMDQTVGGIDINTTKEADFLETERLLKGFRYSQWGTDDLKEAVVEGNLDIALVYSGDFFDTLYYAMDNDIERNFDMYVDQERNNVWFDAMVIPKTATKVELAHEFINFFIEEENAVENASYIGYCPPLTAVYNAVKEDDEIAELVDHPGYYPGNVNGQVYRYLGNEIALRMDRILSNAKIG